MIPIWIQAFHNLIAIIYEEFTSNFSISRVFFILLCLINQEVPSFLHILLFGLNYIQQFSPLKIFHFRAMILCLLISLLFIEFTKIYIDCACNRLTLEGDSIGFSPFLPFKLVQMILKAMIFFFEDFIFIIYLLS